jgi:DNA-binding response OmpR family regulator
MSNILIADDSQDLLEMLYLVFKRNNFTIFTVNNRASLEEYLQRIIPSVIIIDAYFREHDGREICKELKQNKQFKNTHIILMSGNPKVLQDYKDYYADDILEKPFSIEYLLSKIESLSNEATRSNK